MARLLTGLIVATLLAADGAVVVPDAAALETFVRRSLIDTDYAHALGMRAQALVQSQLGATHRTAELITSLLADQPTPCAKNRTAA